MLGRHYVISNRKNGRTHMAPALGFPALKRMPRLGGLEVHRAGFSTLVVFEFVGQALLFIERFHPGGLDRADEDERIAASGFIGDEAITLGGVEKFHCADRHI
jgi:hypothetical protein